MKNIYCFLAGLLVAFALLRGWQPPVGRYQIKVESNIFTKADTATGRIWALEAAKNQWKEIAP